MIPASAIVPNTAGFRRCGILFTAVRIVRNFIEELIRRGVLRALGAYVAIVWLLAQGLVDLLPAVGMPDWAIRIFLSFAVAATPVVAIVAWRYDLTRKGFLRDRADVALAHREAVAGPTVAPTRTSRADHGPTANFIIANWTDNKGNERSQRFFDTFLVGRDYEADIRLTDDCVSRRHLEVYRKEENWFVRDLDSLNGSFIDGTRVDVRKIDADIDITLDRSGPKIRLEVLPAQATALGTSSRRS